MKILVIGDSCLDIFIKGTADRLCPEAPVPVLKPVNKTINPGMAGNLDANLRSISRDNEVTFVTHSSSITKTRFVDQNSGYILLRVDENDSVTEQLDLMTLVKLLAADGKMLRDFDAIAISDYDKGYLTVDNLQSIITCIKNHTRAVLYMDTKKILGEWSRRVDIVKINSKEYKEQLKYSLNPEQYCQTLIVTMGAEGSKIVGDDDVYLHVRGEKVEVMDVSGAGDTYLAALITKLDRGQSFEHAMAYANKAAAVAVSKHGVVTVKPEEIKD